MTILAQTSLPRGPSRFHWPERQDDEAVLDPDLPIIDAHHHLWERGKAHYLFHDYLGDIARDHNIVASVFVQCQSMYRATGPVEMRPIGETEFVNGVAAMSASGQYGPARLCAGIVGFADLRLGAGVQDVLQALIAAAPARFRGIRYGTAWDASDAIKSPTTNPPRGLLLDATFREGFAKLHPLGLSYDAWLHFPQLPELADIAGAFEDTSIIVNHVGGILGIGPYAGKRDEIFVTWKNHMAELAHHENISVKLGGLGMDSRGFGFNGRDPQASSSELATAWTPYIETCIEMFGPARCLFESNFPADKECCSYRVIWNALKRTVAGASANEKAMLFHDTAKRLYRLP